MLKKLKLNGSIKTYRTFRTNTQKRCAFHYRGLNAKVGSQDTLGATCKFGLGMQNEAGQRLIVLPRERTGHSKHPLPTTQEKTTHGHHQMVDTEIRLITFFAAIDGEALYSQQKQDREMTVAWIMNSLLPNSD